MQYARTRIRNSLLRKLIYLIRNKKPGFLWINPDYFLKLGKKMMLKKPKFKDCFYVEMIESVGVFLRSELESFVLTGKLYERLVPLIDGDRTVDNIVETLSKEISITEIYYALMLLEKKVYIVENDSLSSEIGAFLDLANIDRSQAQTRLKSTQISVTSVNQISPQPLIDILKLLNLQIAESGDIEIVLTDDYLRDELELLNQQALKIKRPWMLVKPVGSIIWLGPIFAPGKTGCWQCLAQRLRNNRPIETFIQTQKGIAQPLPNSVAMLPSIWQTGLNLAVTELIKWIVQGENKSLENRLLTFDTKSLNIQTHTLVKRPQCPVCGDSDWFVKKPLPIILKSCKKSFTTDGGHRCFSPEETLHKYEHHISSITGIIKEMKPISLLESHLTNTYITEYNFIRNFDNLADFQENLHSTSGGKGKTDIQARASAFCEAIERHSGVFQGDEVRQKASYQELGDSAIHPNDCMNFSQFQFNRRLELNAKIPRREQRIPEPFDEKREIEWTPLWSLTHHRVKYLPTFYCYFGYSLLHNIENGWANSNGHAAGNTIEEAILQGFMELVERDSVAIWWYNQINRPGVNLDSFDEPYLAALRDYYQTINRELWVLDITNDFQIPTFAAICRRTDKKIEDIIFGFGAHFDAKIAILRAVTEVNQSLPAVRAITTNSDPDEYKFFNSIAREWYQTAAIGNQPYLVPNSDLTTKVYRDYPQPTNDDLREDILTCIETVQKLGMEMLVLDQTRPDLGMNVVKVIVPGMRHFWRRLGPGRLYDVPVKLGWLSAPLLENQLNSFNTFF